MTLCRCPHCQTTFQVSIPPGDRYWDEAPIDEDGLTLWVCYDCHQQGLPPISQQDIRRVGHDTSFR